jgi:predicted hotdog family 3-hydroxylacyl-ACP dehydratase
MISRHDIEAMIPHKGAMCLWDEVVDWDAQRIRLRSAGHRDAAHPLRSDDRLRAVHLCEYGAQAMAVHGGLRGAAAGGEPKVGFLASARSSMRWSARPSCWPKARPVSSILFASCMRATWLPRGARR